MTRPQTYVVAFYLGENGTRIPEDVTAIAIMGKDPREAVENAVKRLGITDHQPLMALYVTPTSSMTDLLPHGGTLRNIR